MNNILTIAQITLAVLLIVVVLLQQQGVGLSASFGGSGNVFRTKRGLEKVLYNATITIGILFMATGAARLFIG